MTHVVRSARRALPLVAAFALLPLAACTSISELAHTGVTPMPYGGTRLAVAGVQGKAGRQLPLTNPYLTGADLPLTAVLDTAFLPANGIAWALDQLRGGSAAK